MATVILKSPPTIGANESVTAKYVTSSPLPGDKVGMDIVSNPPSISTRVDEPSSSVTYVGKAAISSDTSDPVWQIFKMTVSGTQTIITFADGNNNFDNIWDNRASLTYS